MSWGRRISAAKRWRIVNGLLLRFLLREAMKSSCEDGYDRAPISGISDEADLDVTPFPLVPNPLEGNLLVKRSLDDLAMFGGPLAFADPLHIGRPNLGDRKRFLERINDLLDRRWLTNDGKYLREFEAAVAAQVGVDHCIAVCNGTLALQLSARALRLTGEVIVPSFTFIATPHAIELVGLKPVFCDIDPTTHNLDLDRIESLVTPRTSAILGVHLWGRACDAGGLQEIADRHGLELFFDAAHAFGCARDGVKVGNFGRAETFSFHATKFINCFEGGAIVTNDAEIAKSCRLMRNFGFSNWDYVDCVGTNGKLNEASAAMGLTLLEEVDDIVEANRLRLEIYQEGLCRAPRVQVLKLERGLETNFQYAVCEIEPEEGSLTRDQLVAVLHREGVLARRYFYPGCHRMKPYADREHAPLPATEAVADRVLVLPTGPTVAPQQIQEVCELITYALSNGRAIRARMEAGGASGAGSGN